MKKVKSGLILVLTCLLLVSFIACGDQADEVQQQQVEVGRGDILVSVAADGSLSLLTTRGLTFGTSGKITELNVEEGDRVTEGRVLAVLDTIPLERMVRTAEQTVKTAELAVETAEVALKATELDVKAGELAVKSAEIDLEVATNAYYQLTAPNPYVTYGFALPESVDMIRSAQGQLREARDEFQKGLEGEQYSLAKVKEKLVAAEDNLEEAELKLSWGFGSGIRPLGISYWTLRSVQIQVDKAQLAVDAANNNLDKIRNGLETAEKGLSTTKNNLDITKNDLERANDELENAVITAPFDGTIASVDAKEQDILSAVNYATKVIVELIDLTSMELSAELDEVDIPDVKMGQKAIIGIDALPDVQLEGKVTSIRSLPREESGLVLYTVKVSFDVPAGLGLKAGMTAAADIVIDERSDVLLVPRRAIGQDSSGNPVVNVLVDGQIEERPVVIGISDDFQTEIVDGLNEDEVVVVESRVRK
ncbi:efflux RND transporter periplasmic adaptor subunit [Chloroflexota bacterium]